MPVEFHRDIDIECPKCGSEVMDDDFCSECGAELHSDEEWKPRPRGRDELFSPGECGRSFF